MSFSNEAPGHLMISPHFSILISAKDNLQTFSHYWWVGPGLWFRRPSSERENTSRVTNCTTGRHISHTNTKRDDSHQLLLCSPLRMLSILVCHRMGTPGKCQTDASKFITMDRFLTGGRHLYTHTHAQTHKPSKHNHHPQPFIDAVKTH